VRLIIVELIRFVYWAIVELYYLLFVQARLEFSLRRKVSFYGSLKSRRGSFRRQVWEFLVDIEFIPRESIRIRSSQKVVIAAHAIRLSQFLNEHAYNFYKRIILYPDHYLSQVTGKHHKGEVNPGLRTIVFSMRAVSTSLQLRTPGEHVLYHEFAHALWLEHLLMNKNYQVFNGEKFNNIRSLIQHLMAEAHHHHFLRAYAFTNEAEFFAVAIENYYTNSERFRAELPDLFTAVAELLTTKS
jgi:Mlc titration factor MtfA (ptsG expression regulator)